MFFKFENLLLSIFLFMFVMSNNKDMKEFGFVKLVQSVHYDPKFDYRNFLEDLAFVLDIPFSSVDVHKVSPSFDLAHVVAIIPFEVFKDYMLDSFVELVQSRLKIL